MLTLYIILTDVLFPIYNLLIHLLIFPYKPADFRKCFRRKSAFRIIWRYIAGLLLVRIGSISCKNLASYNVEFPWGIY